MPPGVCKLVACEADLRAPTSAEEIQIDLEILARRRWLRVGDVVREPRRVIRLYVVSRLVVRAACGWREAAVGVRMRVRVRVRVWVRVRARARVRARLKLRLRLRLRLMHMLMLMLMLRDGRRDRVRLGVTWRREDLDSLYRLTLTPNPITLTLTPNPITL